MIILTLMKDKEVGWVERFPDQKTCDLWLAKARTEPGFDKEWVATFEDTSAADKAIDDAIVAARAQKLQAKQDLEAQILAIKTKKSKTVADLDAAFALLTDYLGLK